MLRNVPVIALVTALVACEITDVPGQRINERTYVVDSASATKVVLHDAACPAMVTTIDIPGGRSYVDNGHFAAEPACLGALKVGATVTSFGQRYKQGCMPGTPHHTVLGGCELGDLVSSEHETGTPCH